MSPEPEIRKSILPFPHTGIPTNGAIFVIAYGNTAISARNEPPNKFK